MIHAVIYSRVSSESERQDTERQTNELKDYATSLYKMGASKSKIGEAMGHSNIKVTEHYFGSLGLDEISQLNKLLPRKNP